MARRASAKATTTGAQDPLWTSLYDLADRLFFLKPWEFLGEDELFAVQNPETGELSYACVMGAMGTHSALALYRGADGLNGLLKMRLAGEPDDDGDFSEILSWQDCLMLSFEDRDEVSERQRARIKTLGRSYRGRGAWPHFQSFVPHQFPWEVPEKELSWLVTALEQALDVLERVGEGALLLPEPEPLGPHLVRVRDEAGVWDDALLPVPPRHQSGLAPAPLDDALVTRLRALGRVSQGLELGRLPFPQPMQEYPEDPPYFVEALLLVEPESGLVLGHALGRHDKLPVEAVALLAKGLEGQGILPSALAVSDPTLYQLLLPLAAALDINLALPESLPGFEEAAESLALSLGMFAF